MRISNLKESRVFGLTLVKNEADILPQMLANASRFCHRIYVFDLGSTDDSFEIAKGHDKDGIVVAWKKEKVAYHNGRRARIFNNFKGEARPGDWWLRLDADEFYDEDPRPLLVASAKRHEYVVCSKHVQFYYTDKDYELWRAGRETLADRVRPIGERRRYYRVNSTEPRFFMHRDSLEWDERFPWPHRLGLYAKERIFVRHYQFRDPVQMEQRIQDRLAAKREGCGSFSHVQEEDWQRYIRKAADMHCLAGKLESWEINPDELSSHLERIGRRLLKRLYYAILPR